MVVTARIGQGLWKTRELKHRGELLSEWRAAETINTGGWWSMNMKTGENYEWVYEETTEKTNLQLYQTTKDWTDYRLQKPGDKPVTYVDEESEVYRKLTHTDQCLLFRPTSSNVTRTLHQRAKSVPTRAEGKQREHQQSKKALQTTGYPNWAFVKSDTDRDRMVHRLRRVLHA